MQHDLLGASQVTIQDSTSLKVDIPDYLQNPTSNQSESVFKTLVRLDEVVEQAVNQALSS